MQPSRNFVHVGSHNRGGVRILISRAARATLSALCACQIALVVDQCEFWWSLWEDVVKILMISCQRSLHELEQALIIRSCEDPADILDASLHCLAQVLTRRSCGHLGAVLSKRSWHDLAQDLSKKSCGDPGKILSKRSYWRCIRGACAKALLGSCRKILQNPLQQQQVLLWRSCEIRFGALTRRSHQGLYKIFSQRKCERPGGIL